MAEISRAIKTASKMNDEIWKPIKGYEGAYEISSFGRIKRLSITVTQFMGRAKRVYPEMIRLNQVMPNGYITIHLKRKNYFVHRLVAKTFLKRVRGKNMVNHKDGVRSNNHVDNLEWCNQSENMRHAFDVLKVNRKPPKRMAAFEAILKKQRRPVDQYSMDGQFIRSYESITKCSRDTGICITSIRLCCQGTYKKADKFIFKYHLTA